jgi:UDP-glucuronate 4-epimerase
VAHLGAQAGVRYSIDNPSAYIQSNIVGTANLLEISRHSRVGHFVYASSSSVYGMNRSLPFDEQDSVDHPISLYAASKKADELIAHTYSHLHGLPTTGLRFFTVYGPWGRPDMALFKFTKAILEGRPIEVYNHGKMRRDFTYIDDIVVGTANILAKPAESNHGWSAERPTPDSSSAPYRVYNIGNHESVELMRFINVLESAIGKKAELVLLPMQAGDVLETYASIDRLQEAIGYEPKTPIEVGIPKFVEWYRGYYGV